MDETAWFTIQGVNSARVYFAGIILGLTLATTVWVYTYETTSLVRHIDRTTGQEYQPPERIKAQPWWAAPTTVGLLALGAFISVSLLPQDQRTRITTRIAASRRLRHRDMANPS
jgi:hypothetical protein